jgi:hypothetical protein
MKSQEQKADESVSRREWATTLLSSLGAAAFVGCTDGGNTREDEISSLAQALSGTDIKWVDTFTALRAETPENAHVVIVTTGHGLPASGGIFAWVASALRLTEDQGTIFHSSVDTNGYWRRLYSGPVDVRWFGANPTLSDNSSQIQAALNSSNAMGGGTVFIPSGCYNVRAPLELRSGTNLVGECRESTILKKTVAVAASTVACAGDPDIVVYRTDGPSKIGAPNCVLLLLNKTGQAGRYIGTIRDLTLMGNESSIDTVTFGIVGGDLSDSTLSDVHIYYVSYAAIFVSIFASTLRGLRMQTCGRGLGIDGGTSLLATHNYASTCRDWGYWIRGLLYSQFTSNACDSVNDSATYPTRTGAFAYRFQSLIACSLISNGQENTFGTNWIFDDLVGCTFTSNLALNLKGLANSNGDVAIYQIETALRNNNIADNYVWAEGAYSHPRLHNIYAPGVQHFAGTRWRNNLIATGRNGGVETGYGDTYNIPRNMFLHEPHGNCYGIGSTATGGSATTTALSIQAVNSNSSMYVKYGSDNEMSYTIDGNTIYIHGCLHLQDLILNGASGYLLPCGFPVCCDKLPGLMPITGIDGQVFASNVTITEALHLRINAFNNNGSLRTSISNKLITMDQLHTGIGVNWKLYFSGMYKMMP